MFVVRGGHKGPLRKIFKRNNNHLSKFQMVMHNLDNTPFDEMDTILEVKKGTLVVLHGRLPHYSSANKSLKSRHAYTLHVIDSNCDYPDFNWLQRSNNMPLKGFLD
jgi:phytanoyl-CoA hydroxylase